MQNAIHTLPKRIRALAFGLAATGMVLANVASVAAASLTSASLELSDPRTGQTGVNYTFSAASMTAATTIECIQLEFNTAADGSGGVPTGMTTTGFGLTSSSAITAGSWTPDGSVNGTLELVNATGQTPAASGNFVFNTITNGSTEATTYYAIYTSYVNDDCTTPVDTVTVAYVFSNGELVELVIEPTLTFICATVASGQAVNGATTTHASSATGIDYSNDVTSGTNGVSAHDLQVTTNASNGYVVYLRHTGNLANQTADTITTHAGTNGSPTSFTAAGTESWGYTTNDSTLVGGTADRFTNPANAWAGFTTSNEEVASNTTGTTGTETTRVGQQVGISANTEAGKYQTTLIYTVVATF
jgi:hypothetical protein